MSEAAFIDVKLLVLALGTLLIWVSGVPVDRQLAAPALALGVAVALATVFGVDPAESLVGTVRPTASSRWRPRSSSWSSRPASPNRSWSGPARGWSVSR